MAHACALQDAENLNSQEECMHGVMNWEMLRTGVGVYKNIDDDDTWWMEVQVRFTYMCACIN